MGERVLQVLVVLGLVAVVAVPVGVKLLADADASAEHGEATERLVIITPHNEQIRFEMTEGFNRWRAAQGFSPVEFDWRASGGTTDLRKGILSQFTAKAKRGQVNEGIGADLFFGGGAYDHGKVADGVDLDGDGPEEPIMVAVQPWLPEGLLDLAIPDPEAFGAGAIERLYFRNEQGQVLWIGVVLSSFGIIYNVDALKRLDVPAPQVWDDLTNPRLENWVALANPSHSGSAAAAYNAILQRSGWTEGWHTLRRSFANSRYFTSSASKVPVDVTTRDAAMGMAIDFYGRVQAGSVPAAPDRVRYVDPVKQVEGKSITLTATTADPITLLRGAPNRETAEQFIAWLLMPETQLLWQKKLGEPGGPVRFELRRQPIRPDVYADKTGWADPEIDPFATAAPLPPGTPNYFGMVSPITNAMAIDIHDDLAAAWAALVEAEATGHPKLAEMREAFDAMPRELTLDMPDHWQIALSDANHADHEAMVANLKAFAGQLKKIDTAAKRREWREFFEGQYRLVVDLSKQR